MDDYVKLMVGLGVCFTIGYSVFTYSEAEKAKKAMEIGLQECSEVDTYGHTIILFKKECK